MQPIVAVIAPGMMGSAVGGRLAQNGVEVRTSLDGRSAATIARAKAAGMIGVAGRRDRRRRHHPVDPAARRGAGTGGATRPRPARRGEKADLRRLQRAGSRHRAAHRPRHRGNRRHLRRWRHHRRPAGAGQQGHPHLSVRRGGAQVAVLEQYGLEMPVQPGPIGAASAMKMSYAGITKGFTALGAAMMLAATRAGTADALKAELSHQPAGAVRLADPADAEDVFEGLSLGGRNGGNRRIRRRRSGRRSSSTKPPPGSTNASPPTSRAPTRKPRCSTPSATPKKG